MMRFRTALAVTVFTIFALAGCNDYGNTFQNNTGAALSFLSPSQISAGSGDFTLNIQGGGFVLKTVVQWNGKPLATTVAVDSTGAALGNSVSALVPAALIAKPGVATVLTVNPASGAGNNGLSNTITFIINNPANPIPAVTLVSPACAPPSADLPLTITGTNFLSGTSQSSTVNWNLGASQFQFSPAAVNSSQITVTIPAADIATTGTATVTVSNPPSLPLANVPGSTGSGGGTSSPSSATSVTIQTPACPTAVKAQSPSELPATVAEETPAVSLDGRFVAYTAVLENHSQIYLRDTCEGASAGCQPHTTMLSLAADGAPANDDSHTPSMSSDGRFVAFSSAARNLVENTPAGRQVYLFDTCTGGGDSCKPTTHLVSTDPAGALVGAESILPSVSSSGRFVAFLAVTPSRVSNPASAQSKNSLGAANSGLRQVFVRDTCLGATNCTPKTTRISLQPGDGSGSNSKPAGPALSGNAKHVAIFGADSATMFTRSIAVDDRVFLAIANQQH